MKKKLLLLSTLLLSGSFIMQAEAQRDNNSSGKHKHHHKVDKDRHHENILREGEHKVIDLKDDIVRDVNDSFANPISSRLQLMRTTPEIAKILQEGRPHEPHAIPVPKFVVVNPHNQNFILTVGGQLNFIVGGDFGNNLYKQPTAGISFVTNAIPVPSVLGKRVDLYINAINGSADMQVVGFANTKNQVTGYFKIGTNGISTNIVLQRAYVSWRGITGGLKLNLFQDDYACQPPTIDPEGPSGEVSAVSYEIGYTSKSYKGWKFAAALSMPTYYSSLGYYRGLDYPEYKGEDLSTMDYDQFVPDVPLWVEHSWSQWNRIRVSGILRTFRYRDEIEKRARLSLGWGAMLSGNVQPSSKWILYYQFAFGKGIGNYIQDIAGHPYSFIPRDDHPGWITPSPMMGANIGVSFNPTSKLQFNAMFSEARIWNVKTYADMQDESLNYKYALYGAVNCFYNLNSFLQLGVEYLYGYRETWNIGGSADNRLQAQVSFSF